MVLETEEFTVVLPSNSNLTTHGRNSPTDYTVQLRTPRELAGARWEASLLNVHYPVSWRNVAESRHVRVFFFETPLGARPVNPDVGTIPPTVTVRYHVGATYPNDVTFETRGKKLDCLYAKILVPAGYYSSVTQIGERIADAFKKMYQSLQGVLATPQVEYIYDIGTSSGRFVLGRGNLIILLDDEYLSEVLGHGSNTVRCEGTNPGSETVMILHSMALNATRPPSLKITDSLYVYCDFIEDRAIGDADAKLLGIVPVSGSHGQRSYWSFVQPDYAHVSKRSLTTLSIRIRDDKGNPIEFAGRNNHLVCTVRFKPMGI